MVKKLYRSSTDKMISGVCAGIAEYYSIDPTLVRIGTVILLFVTGFFPMLIGYIICAAIIPERPYNLQDDDVEVIDRDGNRVHSEKKNSRIIGLVLIGFGGFLLFDRFFWWIDHRIYWALAIIAVGAFIIFSGSYGNKPKDYE